MVIAYYIYQSFMPADVTAVGSRHNFFLMYVHSILRQSSKPVCGSWKIQAKQSLTCSIMENQKPHAGLNDCLRMLQACLRTRMSGRVWFRARAGCSTGESRFLSPSSLLPLTSRKRAGTLVVFATCAPFPSFNLKGETHLQILSARVFFARGDICAQNGTVTSSSLGE